MLNQCPQRANKTNKDVNRWIYPTPASAGSGLPSTATSSSVTMSSASTVLAATRTCNPKVATQVTQASAEAKAPANAPAKAERGRESYALLLDALEEARAAGVARADLSARELALVAWSLVHGLSSLVSSGRVPVSEARVRRYADLLDEVFFEGAGSRAR